ncbi:MAG: hypothetical protein ACREIF_19065 [Chthoniobacterales bacterium]
MITAAVAQGRRTSFELHTLGWRDFQGLCATILTEVLGQTFQRFADTADAGRDGAFHGRWKRRGREELRGSFVVQCKFTAKSSGFLRPADLRDEIAKAGRLASKGLARNYLLLTNASLSARTEEDLRRQFTSIPKIRHFEAFGREWITNAITENQRLRTLVPRVYGLGDLTELLDERVYEQGCEILSWLGDELNRFVVTDSHYRSVQALESKGFVLLLGDPGSGKSTIAAALSLAAADTWRSRVIKVLNTRDFTDHWNPREPNQFFWVDDAFGQRQYERERALDWNHALPHLSAAIRRGARAIFTSRTYIYRDAVEDLKESLFPLLKESRVVIEVEKLTKAERQQILYNHIRLGNQPKNYRATIKPYLEEVSEQNKFLPETARRLGERMFTKNVIPTREGLLDFVVRQEDYLRDVIVGLGDSNKAALGIAFMRGGRIKAGLDLEPDEQQPFQLLNASLGQVRKSIYALEGSLLVKELDRGETYYKFKHPTIRDAYGAVVADDANLIDIFLRGARPQSLIDEVTCGDVGLEGVKLIVPPERFQLMVDKLSELRLEPGGPRALLSFLVTRCSRAFLQFFLHRNQSYLGALNFPYWFGWSQEAKFFALLSTHGLLPERQRQRFVRALDCIAGSRPQWPFAYNSELRNVLRPSELRALRARVRRRLTAKILTIETASWKAGWEGNRDEGPSEHFWPWKHQLDYLAHEFRRDRRVYKRFATAQRRLDTLVQQLEKEQAKKEGDLSAASATELTANRSVFEDVDQ